MLKRVILIGGLTICAAAALELAATYQDQAVRMYRFWKYGPDRPPPPSMLGQEILDGLKTDRIRDVAKEYGRVQTLLNIAKARGVNVDSLQSQMDFAMRLGQMGKYVQSIQILDSVEMSIPKPPEEFTAAGADDGELTSRQSVAGAPVASKAEAAVKRKKKRKKKVPPPADAEASP